MIRSERRASLLPAAIIERSGVPVVSGFLHGVSPCIASLLICLDKCGILILSLNCTVPKPFLKTEGNVKRLSAPTVVGVGGDGVGAVKVESGKSSIADFVVVVVAVVFGVAEGKDTIDIDLIGSVGIMENLQTEEMGLLGGNVKVEGTAEPDFTVIALPRGAHMTASRCAEACDALAPTAVVETRSRPTSSRLREGVAPLFRNVLGLRSNNGLCEVTGIPAWAGIIARDSPAIGVLAILAEPVAVHIAHARAIFK